MHRKVWDGIPFQNNPVSSALKTCSDINPFTSIRSTSHGWTVAFGPRCPVKTLVNLQWFLPYTSPLRGIFFLFGPWSNQTLSALNILSRWGWRDWNETFALCWQEPLNGYFTHVYTQLIHWSGNGGPQMSPRFHFLPTYLTMRRFLTISSPFSDFWHD